MHACTGRQLLDWIDDELWTIELGGEIVEGDDMLVAERGRLIARVDSWNARTAGEFSEACAWRSRDYALRALRRVGLTEDAKRLVDAFDLRGMRDAAAAAADSTDGEAAEIAAFAADTVSLVEGDRPDSWRAGPRLRAPEQTPGAIAANLSFVVANTAGREASASAETAYEQAFEQERAWQLDWLERRLGVPLGG